MIEDLRESESMDDLFDATVGGFNLLGLLLAFVMIAVCLFIIYWMWDCSCRQIDEVEERRYNYGNPVPAQCRPVVPLYAFELEPGTVVLQSADGEIFRILREYDSVGRTGKGCPPLYESVATSSTSNQFHCMPSYTRAHFQTKPTAPDDDTFGGSEGFQPRYQPTGDAFGDDGTWTPLRMHSH